MRCAICGGATPPAAKLCGACKAALKRARHETVSQLDPLPRRRSRGGRPESGEGLRNGEDAPLRGRTPHDRLRLPASVVALGVVVVATGYFVSHLRGAAQAPDLSAVAAMPATRPYVPLPTSTASPSAPSDAVVLPRRPPDVLPPVPAPKSPTLTRTAKNGRPTATEPPPQAAVAPPAAPAEPPAAPAPPPAAEPPAPDRWQLLAAAIARCDVEGGLGGVICTERARWQYCDGYWGKAAQCPAAIGRDFQR